MTTIAKAIQNFESKTEKVAVEEKKVLLYCQIPPIKKIDPSALASLQACEHLALSTNQIDRMDSFANIPNLRILSLGRNLIKKIDKLDDVAGTLEELWISYNQIKTLDGLSNLENLTTLYISNNLIADWSELDKIAGLPHLKDILLVGNPIYEGMEPDVRRIEVLKHLPNLMKLDGEMVKPSEREAAASAAEEV